MNSVWGNFRRWNSITGWFVFLVSAVVYLMTVEPTVSFWDCGEFILSAFRLQVGHPPGAPLFLMMGRIATLFAGDDNARAAIMINRMSALCSAFAIMFLFWTITHLIRRIFTRNTPLEARHIPAIIGSGLVGALAYTFSDTFWFSAVESEVYALSSLILGLVFWTMLKWEEEADEPASGRWIILAAYLMGLGLGVHRLNLLGIPVLVLVFYFRKYGFSPKSFIKALIVAMVILWLMVFVLLPGVPKVAEWFELFFVNVIGLPYNSGLLVYIILLIAGLVFGIRYSLRKRKIVLNYVMTILAVIMIGYSSYAMIMIRSSARPPMNQNNPSDVFALSYYINMEQYGSSPKLYGNYYSAPIVGSKDIIAGYNKVDGKYEPYYRPDYEYSKEFETVFPRMYSNESDHETAYKYWGKVKGRRYSVGRGNDRETIVCPTFGENLRFFFRYQVGFMYLRYFMWNFAGRQNDIQADGNNIDGNWISGIKFIDEARLGNLERIPDDLKNNWGTNKYYLLPLLIGLAGLAWHYKRDRNGFILVLTFFIMTGFAIILYLNQTPDQPRERDYAYAGSFYAFAIWIGMGVMYGYELLQKYIGHKFSAIITTLVLLAVCPVLMGEQNWNDHDRSGRYTARDIGTDYLESCAPNSILFSYGDNDSFPVWYVQDVEEIRTDIRVANLSYIQAGWYINMMRQKAFKSDPLPFTLGPDKYLEGVRDQMPVINSYNKPVNIKDVIQFVAQDDRKFKKDITGRGDYLNYIPTNKFLIDVDTAQVLANGTVKEYYKNRIVSPMIWDYTGQDAFKGDLAIMDILATNNWKRPIYISSTVPATQYKGLQKFFVQEGLTYRIVPIKIDEPEQGEYGMIDPNVMYENMMNKFRWGNAADPKVYLDENNRRMFANFRRLFGSLGEALIQSGDTVRALKAINKGLSIVPADKIPHDYFSVQLAEDLIRCGKKKEGLKLLDSILNYSRQYLEYAVNLRSDERYGLDLPTGINMQVLLDVYRVSDDLKIDSLTRVSEQWLNNYYGRLYSDK